MERDRCVFCKVAVSQIQYGICDQCYAPFIAYLEAGGTPREYIKELAKLTLKAVAEKVVREIVKKAINEGFRDVN